LNAAAIRSASAGFTRRGVPFQKIMLSAQAPSYAGELGVVEAG